MNSREELKLASMWQERAPQGPWFVETPHDGHIFFGSDTDSAKQCMDAINRHAQSPLDLDYVLPCDVHLKPVTTITKGCKLSTLMAALKIREAPFFECPECSGDIATDGHKPSCTGAWLAYAFPLHRQNTGCEMTRDKMAELADEIERSEGLLRIVPGEGIVSLGIKRTAMVVAALRCVPPIDDYTNEWHPISSVPTDGRPIFALHNTQGPQALFANVEWIESQCKNYTHWTPRKVGDRSDKAPPVPAVTSTMRNPIENKEDSAS